MMMMVISTLLDYSEKLRHTVHLTLSLIFSVVTV